MPDGSAHVSICFTHMSAAFTHIVRIICYKTGK
jgi:hypothetical protein